jgi:hypothetical protein
MEKHQHVQLPHGATATVAPDCPPSTLAALAAVVEIAKPQAEAGCPASAGSPKLWFTYDACDGFEEHETEAAARAYAESLIDQYRMDAPDDGWSDEVWSVRVGRITAWTVETERRKPEEEEGTAWDWICDYGLSENS